MRKLIQIAVGLALGGALLSASAGASVAAEKAFGPFIVDDRTPHIIKMEGAVDASSALNFRRALQAAPEANLITLDSPGGNVHMGLLIADDIHERKISTYIPANSQCFSACSFIFLAGYERKVDGDLGVHQISQGRSDLVSAQLAISDIIEVLNRFGTPIDVMQIMFKTPPDEMHVFTQEEIAQYKLNRLAPDQSHTHPVMEEKAEQNSDIGVAVGARANDPVEPPGESSLGTEEQKLAKLSSLEEFTNRPNRIAIYTGLDLFGDDIASSYVEDAAACARECLLMTGKCKAFTFNISQKIRRGPNCFLKSSSGRADGNSLAFSGQLLTAVDRTPSSMTLATIDPVTSLFEDVDLPGRDLSRHPLRDAKTAQSCRLACIDDASCVAFTYVKSRKECWLKGSISTPTLGKGMISGLKSYESFEPSTIISLD